MTSKKKKSKQIATTQILIVDDNANLCKSVQLIFNKVGYNTIIAHSGTDAIHIVERNKIDLALLDIRLPDMDGIELLQKLSDLQPVIDVIMITGHATVEAAVETLTGSAAAFVTKPIDMDELLRIVSETLDRRRLRQEKQVTERELELFISLLRHDLSNDIQILMADLEFIQHLSSDLNGESSDALESALATTERMFSLIVALKQPIENSEEKILMLIENLAREAEKMQKNMTINIRAAKGIENLENRSCRLLPMVFTNVISNAAKFGKREVTVTIELEQEGENIIIIIYDDGPGIDDEIISRLFQRGASTTGGGYGLHLSRSIVETIGGVIELVDPKNAKFRITLPLKSK